MELGDRLGPITYIMSTRYTRFALPTRSRLAMRTPAALLLAAVLAAGCPAQPVGTAKLPSPPVDAGPSAPVRLALSVREHLLDGGVQPVELQPNDRTLIEPTRQIEVLSNVPLRNYRVRLFDEADRAVISDDAAETTADGMRYRIVFHQPLEPGHRYALVVDHEAGLSLTDSQGLPQPEQRLELQVIGEREKARPLPSRRPQRRHR